ncbi:squamosa promoter binding -like 5 [Chlorella sorokiniana]|uniref:Squamosa promoter binding-like 5 n=1 Tax=Chlorella sorokiniana TaxID=3076 RepID=A0A2P6TKX3_CHLSO|nr:squamosa promoter binding -like 5 [Chlorella sorokiniana]|eukprot:PRW44947.1 squamosa promoter binding -like 5 [Chlorella sorokiniana]
MTAEPWRPSGTGAGLRRQLRYDTPLSQRQRLLLPFGPAAVHNTEEQQLAEEDSSGGLRLISSVASEGVPFANCFTNRLEWRLLPLGSARSREAKSRGGGGSSSSSGAAQLPALTPYIASGSLDSSTRLLLIAQCVFHKRVLGPLRGQIEEQSLQGMRDAYARLAPLIQQHFNGSRGGSGLSGVTNALQCSCMSTSGSTSSSSSKRRDRADLSSASGGSDSWAAAQALSAGAVAASLWALAVLGGSIWWEVEAEALCALLPACRSATLREASDASWALATMRHYTPHLPVLEEAAAAALEQRLGAAAKQPNGAAGSSEQQGRAPSLSQLASLLWGLATLGHRPLCLLPLMPPALGCQPGPPSFTALCTIAWSLAVAGCLQQPAAEAVAAALCAAAGSVPPAGPKNAALLQLHQFVLALQLAAQEEEEDDSSAAAAAGQQAQHGSAAAALRRLQEHAGMQPLLAAAASAWAAEGGHRGSKQVSAVQADVAATARTLGLALHEEHAVVGFSVDIAVPARRLAVEVDGPTHFCRNVLPSEGTSSSSGTINDAQATLSSSKSAHALGATLLKRRLLQRQGWAVISVVGCTISLANLRSYFLRQRICEEHAKADAVPDGQGGLCRFCQQCTKLEPLAAFDGRKHSCRASLLKRHHRHRQLSGKALSDSSSEEQPMGHNTGSRQPDRSVIFAPRQAATPEQQPGAMAAAAAALAAAAQGPGAGVGPQVQSCAAGTHPSLSSLLTQLDQNPDAGPVKPMEARPSSCTPGDLASLLAAAGGGAAAPPALPPAPATSLPAGGSLQAGQLTLLCEQLRANSAAAAAAALKAAATGNALLVALCSDSNGSGSGSGSQALLLGQLVMQDLQLLQQMQDNVLLQLRVAHAARAALPPVGPNPLARGAPVADEACSAPRQPPCKRTTALEPPRDPQARPGIVICSVFLLSPSSPPTPLPVVLGMLFTNAICPVLLTMAPAFYARHRTAVVLLARLAFMHGTLHVWQEERRWQRGAMGWPALLMTLAYSSRALVACWGALGWQLPLPWHAAVQALHVGLAGWRLAPAVCSAGGALRGNFSKLQALALLLDWPLRVKLSELASQVFGFYGDPFRTVANEQATAVLDVTGWKLSGLLHVLLAARLWQQERGTESVLALLSYSVVCVGMPALIRWRRALYVRHRELIGSVVHAHHMAVWHHVVLWRGVPLFSLHGGHPLRLLVLLAVANSSIWIMLTFTYARCALSSMRRVLPLLALQQLARSVPLCRCLLQTEGAAAPMRGLNYALAAAHEAALLPFASPAAVPNPDPLHACLAVNAWLVLGVGMVLPLALLQLLEQRVRAGHAGGQHPPEEPAEVTVVVWPMKAYLASCLLWCAVGLGLNVWQAAAPGGLLSAA